MISPGIQHLFVELETNDHCVACTLAPSKRSVSSMA